MNLVPRDFVVMSENERKMAKYDLGKLGDLHPRIRAEDWRSPLVIRLLKNGNYADGEMQFRLSTRDVCGGEKRRSLALFWSQLDDDYKKCRNTYQAGVLTEFAALGLSCVATNLVGAEITEVTRRGDKADYWLDGGSLLLEVSGQQKGNLDTLLVEKTAQLLANPFGKSGYVFVVNFDDSASRLTYENFVP